jgi:RHS repeat-associated protein
LEAQYDKSGSPAHLIANIPDTPKVTYGYMTGGDRMRVKNVNVGNGMVNQNIEYDVEGRVSQVRQTFAGREDYSLDTDYLWDTLSRIKEVRYPKQYGAGDARKVVAHNYDIASRLTELKFGGVTMASAPVYNSSNQMTSLAVGSQITENYGFDPKTGLLLSQQVNKGPDQLVNLQYNYTLDNDSSNNGAKTGQLTSVTDQKNTARNRAYEYDKLGRLGKVKGGVDAFNNPAWYQNYAYDRYGNRTGVTKTGAAPQIPLDGLASLGFNTASNRINTSGFEYDPAGNQTRAVINDSGTQQQYRYDCAGRLTQILDANGNVVATHSYGASNQRLVSAEGGVTRYFAWDGGKIIAEFEASGANALVWKTSYVYMGGRLLATTSGAGGTETRFHHPDRLGTRLVTDADGTVASEQLSMPFGTMLPFTQTYGGENSYQHPTLGNPSKKRFTSYDRSEVTGMDYAVNRFYSSQQGRFAQVDPIGMGAVSLGDPQSLNLYSYVHNDPINFVDPGGLNDLPANGFFFSYFRHRRDRSGVFGSGGDDTSIEIELDSDNGGGSGGDPQNQSNNPKQKQLDDCAIAAVRARNERHGAIVAKYDKISIIPTKEDVKEGAVGAGLSGLLYVLMNAGGVAAGTMTGTALAVGTGGTVVGGMATGLGGVALYRYWKKAGAREDEFWANYVQWMKDRSDCIDKYGDSSRRRLVRPSPRELVGLWIYGGINELLVQKTVYGPLPR